jgi:hypothetical protein
MSATATPAKPARPHLNQEVVEAVELAGATLEKAARAYQAEQARFQVIKAKIPEVVEALVTNGRIEPEEKEACAKALEDPLQTLELLKWAAHHRLAAEGGLPATEVDKDGRPAGRGTTKQAEARRAFHPIGARRDSSEADRAFDEALGLG